MINDAPNCSFVNCWTYFNPGLDEMDNSRWHTYVLIINLFVYSLIFVTDANINTFHIQVYANFIFNISFELFIYPIIDFIYKNSPIFTTVRLTVKEEVSITLRYF